MGEWSNRNLPPEFQAVEIPVGHRAAEPCATYAPQIKSQPGKLVQNSNAKRSGRYIDRWAKRQKGIDGGNLNKEAGRANSGRGRAGANARSSVARKQEGKDKWTSYPSLRADWPDASVVELIMQQAKAAVDLNLDAVIDYAEGKYGKMYRDGREVGGESQGERLQGHFTHPSAQNSAQHFVDRCLTADHGGQKDDSSGTASKIPDASFVVGYEGDLLEIPPRCLHGWWKAPFEPLAAPKPVIYYGICPLASRSGLSRFLEDVSEVYEAGRFGSHKPARSTTPGLESELLTFMPMPGPPSRPRTAAQALKDPPLSRSSFPSASGPDSSPVPGQTDTPDTSKSKLGGSELNSGIEIKRDENGGGACASQLPLDRGFMKSFRRELERLQRVLVLDPPDLRYTGGGLSDHMNTAIVVYVVCPFDDSLASLQLLLEAARTLAPCSVLPKDSEAKDPTVDSASDKPSNNNSPSVLDVEMEEVKGNGAYLERFGGVREPVVLKKKGFNIVIQLVTVDAMRDVTGLAVRSTAMAVYNKVSKHPLHCGDDAREGPCSGMDPIENGDPAWSCNFADQLFGVSDPPHTFSNPQADLGKDLMAGKAEPMLNRPNVYDPGGGGKSRQPSNANHDPKAVLHCSYALVCEGGQEALKRGWVIAAWTNVSGESIHSRAFCFSRRSGGTRKILKAVSTRLLEISEEVSRSFQRAFSCKSLCFTRLGTPHKDEKWGWKKAWKHVVGRMTCQETVSGIYGELNVVSLVCGPLWRVDGSGRAPSGAYCVENSCGVDLQASVTVVQFPPSRSEQGCDLPGESDCVRSWNLTAMYHATSDDKQRNYSMEPGVGKGEDEFVMQDISVSDFIDEKIGAAGQNGYTGLQSKPSRNLMEVNSVFSQIGVKGGPLHLSPDSKMGFENGTMNSIVDGLPDVLPSPLFECEPKSLYGDLLPDETLQPPPPPPLPPPVGSVCSLESGELALDYVKESLDWKHGGFSAPKAVKKQTVHPINLSSGKRAMNASDVMEHDRGVITKDRGNSNFARGDLSNESGRHRVGVNLNKVAHALHNLGVANMGQNGLVHFHPCSSSGTGLGMREWVPECGHLPLHCSIVARIWALFSVITVVSGRGPEANGA